MVLGLGLLKLTIWSNRFELLVKQHVGLAYYCVRHSKALLGLCAILLKALIPRPGKTIIFAVDIGYHQSI